jgi:hypothetical protein
MAAGEEKSEQSFSKKCPIVEPPSRVREIMEESAMIKEIKKWMVLEDSCNPSETIPCLI